MCVVGLPVAGDPGLTPAGLIDGGLPPGRPRRCAAGCVAVVADRLACSGSLQATSKPLGSFPSLPTAFEGEQHALGQQDRWPCGPQCPRRRAHVPPQATPVAAVPAGRPGGSDPPSPFPPPAPAPSGLGPAPRPRSLPHPAPAYASPAHQTPPHAQAGRSNSSTAHARPEPQPTPRTHPAHALHAQHAPRAPHASAHAQAFPRGQ